MNTEQTTLNGVENLGAIRHFEVPPDWQIGRRWELAYGYIYTWHPLDNSDVSINVSYRGHKIDAEDGAAFRAVLATPHVLSAAEYQSLTSVLRDFSREDVFSSNLARVSTVDDVSVLVVSGTYRDQAVGTITVFIDSSGDGRVLQEITYISPADSYERYLPIAMMSFSTLWIT